MNKTELIAAVAAKADLPKTTADRAVTAILNTITEQLANGGSVALTGFGNFQVSQRAARTGRNPQTGQEIKIAAANVPQFKPGSNLKSAVNPE